MYVLFMIIIFVCFYYSHKKVRNKIEILKMNANLCLISSNALYALILMITLIYSTYSAWITYSQFTGYIPSYIYPVTLNAGDTLRGNLSWPGTEDLDLYLYSDGMDLLSAASSSSYIKRQYSPNLNPEILNYVVPTTSKYYLRVDLFGTVPTPYQFDISVNGILQSTSYDTIIKVAAGRSIMQFTVSGPCTIRVIYDGPIYNIYVYSPGTDVISGTATASETTSVNPKSLTAILSSGGKWSIAVHHGLLSTTVLTPFKVRIQTQQSSNQCVNWCSAIPYSAGQIIGYANTCRCLSGFQWISTNQTCGIICSQFNTSGNVGSRVAGSSDQCACLQSGTVWNSTTLACEIDCSTKNWTAGTNTTTICYCQTGFEWDTSILQCVRNCTGQLYSIQANRTIGNNVPFDQCACQSSFNWNASSLNCQINCTSIPFSLSTLSTSSCQCMTAFSWNPTTFLCQIDCSQITNSTGPSLSSNYTCSCPVYYQIDLTLLGCVKNCSIDQYSFDPNRTLGNFSSYDNCQCILKFVPTTIAYPFCQINCTALSDTKAGGNNSIDSCECQTNFYWDALTLQCTRNCTLYSYTLPTLRPNSSIQPYECLCQNLFQWNNLISACQINCTLIPYTDTLGHGVDYCQCQAGFYWEPSLMVCARNCTIIQFGISVNRTNTTIPAEDCFCQNKFSWNNLTELCQIQCQNLNYTVSNSTIASPACQCVQLFAWSPILLQCLINCTLIPYSQSQSPIQNLTSLDSCSCQNYFAWNDSIVGCQVQCDQINNTLTLSDPNASSIIITYNISTNISHTQCMCQPPLQWDSITVACIALQTLPIYQATFNGGSSNSGWGIGTVFSGNGANNPDNADENGNQNSNNLICSHLFWYIIQIPQRHIGSIQDYQVISIYYLNNDINTNTNSYLINEDLEIVSKEYLGSNTIKIVLKLLDTPSNSQFTLKFTVAPPLSTNFLLHLSTPTTVSPAFYTSQQCQVMPSLPIYPKFLLVSSYVILATNMLSFSSKLIGLELFGTLQLAYFSISMHYTDINMYVFILGGLQASNGINTQFFNQDSQAFYSQMPKVLKGAINSASSGLDKGGMNKYGYFVNNYNIMFLIMIGFIIGVGILYLIFRALQRCKEIKQQKQHNQILQHSKQNIAENKNKSTGDIVNINGNGNGNSGLGKIQNKQSLLSFQNLTIKNVLLFLPKMLKQGVLSLLLFSLFNISFSIGVFATYVSSSAADPSAVTLSIICQVFTLLILALLLIQFVRSGSQAANFGQYKQKFKYNPLCRMYVAITFIYRIVVGAMLGAGIDGIYTSLGLLFISLSFLGYHIINLPYLEVWHNYRAGLVHLSNVIILLAGNYYRSMKSNMPLKQKVHDHGPAIAMLIFLGITVIVSIAVCLFKIRRYILKFIKSIKDNKVDNIQNINDNKTDLQNEKKQQAKQQQIQGKQKKRKRNKNKQQLKQITQQQRAQYQQDEQPHMLSSKRQMSRPRNNLFTEEEFIG